MMRGLTCAQRWTSTTLCAATTVFLPPRAFLRGVRYSAKYAVTHSLVLRGKTGTLRYVESYHNMDRLMKFSAVRY